MNSIEKELEKFFTKKLAPLSKQKQYFPLNPDLNVSSYYQKRTKTTMSPKDFEICDGDLQRELEELWKEDRELLELASQLVKLALKLKEQQPQQSEEVSPFIYAMF